MTTPAAQFADQSECAAYVRTFDVDAARNNPAPLLRLLESADPQIALAAVQRFAPSQHHLTPVHVVFLTRCLADRNYSLALPLLDIPLCHFSPLYSTYHHHLLYHFYAASIYLALRMLPQSRQFFAFVIAAPGQCCSQIQLEAYKKWLLISAILGSCTEMPKNASLALQRATTSVISRAYSELATAMQSDCHARVLSVIDKAADVWTEDGNIGLVNLCFNTIPKRIIKKLREIYVTITLQELSRLVFLSPQDAKSLLQQMTSSNNIIAEISSSEIVTFPNTNPTELNSTHTLNLLNNLVQLNKQLGSSKEYLAKQNNSPKEGFVSEFTVEESIMDQDFKDDDIMDFE